VKLLIHKYVEISAVGSLFFIIAVIAISIVASLVLKEKPKASENHE
jgi:hypothetical protein